MYTALTLLVTECTRSWHIFTSVPFNSWRMNSVKVFNGEHCSARLHRIPHCCLRAIRLSEIHVHWRIFTLGGLISSLSCWKNPNNAGNEKVASSVSSVCIRSHSSVWIHDSIDKAQLPHTFSTHSSLYKTLLPLNIIVLLQQHQNILDPKWLTWSLDTRLWIPRSLYFVNMGIGRG